MPIRSYIFVLFIIFITSSVSVGLLYHYMNPLTNPELSLALLGTGIFLSAGSILIMLLFFIKKVYYRGDVTISTMNASVRQGILISFGIVFTGVLYLFHITETRLILAVWATLGCIEVMIQAIE